MFCQNDSIPNSGLNLNWIESPENFIDSVQYDDDSDLIFITKFIGGHTMSLPRYFSVEEYRKYLFKQKFNNYWKERISRNRISDDLGKVNSSGQLINKVFGGSLVDIKPQGSAELIFSGVINKIDNPALPEQQRKTTSFNFDERIQMNVVGTIGDKLQLRANYDTEATFEFENEIKLEYTGDDDDIVKKIELGNVSLPLAGSLITGAQSLFGVKTKFQFGKTTLTTVFSEQKSETSSIEIQGGAQLTDFELSIDNYESNKHFFLSQYFYENYNAAMQNLPIITSPINITKIEVYITNKNSSTINTRNILAFQDLGEAQNLSSPLVVVDQVAFPPYYPSNANNSLNPNGSFIENVASETGDSIRLIDEITSAFSQYTLDGNNFFDQAIDYEKIENARRLSSSEYSYHAQLGFISLNQALNSDEVLAVAFQYTSGGVTYQVGEFSTDLTSPNTLMLKLLKSTVLDVNEPNWNLLMKNVYSLGAYQINQQDFILDILYENPELGAPVNFLTEGPQGIINTPLLQVFNVDNLNSNNDPGSDGVFDFLDGILINSSNGRVYFPMLEPFGCYLREKFGDNCDFPSTDNLANNYCFDALYDSTQAAAQQLAELNKFLLRGQYKSSIGSEISLNAMNIPDGSVKVTSGGRSLEENIHYTVDYTMGRVRIIDEGVLSSSEPIRITLENNSLFNFQSKRFMGAHLDYRFNKDFILGVSALNLTEKPLTQKINIGDEPISNTIVGLNSSFSRDSRFLTKLIDKLPLIETKETSNIAVNSEFAYFIPGHPNSINIDDTGTSYIDDFENSQSVIDIRNSTAWSLSSAPTGNLNNAEGYFAEAFQSNNIEYGYNRAKLAWYVIDPLFQRNSSITPSHISNDPGQQENNYVREVLITEIFPNKDIVNGQPQRLRTFDVAFYPAERGPYNFDVEPSIYSAGINEFGDLNSPESRWGGITRKIETNDFEAANIEFIEFWMLDPFLDNPNHDGGYLYLNLGNISEDILKDSRKSFENGLSIDGSDNNIDTTVWGRVPSIQSLVNAFDNNEGARINQDLGYDGLDDENERSFTYENGGVNISYVDRVFNYFGENTLAYQKAFEDPSSDNFKYFRSSDFDNNETSILERYKNYNGVQGNSPTSEQSTEEYPTSSTNLPDVEDINNDQTLSEVESYYQYKISLKPESLEIGSNYINDIIDNVGPNNNARWIQFKIPIQSYSDKIGSIQDFKSIRFIRTFFSGFNESIVCRFASFDLVRGEWRRYLNDLNDLDINNGTTQFDISVVNFEENGSRFPVPYVLPPGIQRETYYGATSLQQQNEQSMVLKIIDLEDGDSRAAFKNVSMDMRNYKTIEMYSHLESIQENGLEDDSLNLFLRIGTDYISNYYEYEIPLKITQWGDSDPQLIWPSQNRINIPLELLQSVKQLRNDSMRVNSEFTYQDIYSFDENENTISIKGNPNLGNVKTIMIGVRNPGSGNGTSKSGEVWVNELRLSDFNEKGGWAARTQVRLRLADFANLAFAGSMSTVGFGSLEKNISERNLNESKRYNLTASLELGELFPEKSNIKLPMYISVSESVENPQYNPLDPDILLSASLDAYDTKSEKDSIKQIVQDYTKIKSINFTNVRKERALGQNNSKIYDIENFTLSYSYNEIFSRSINTEYSIRKDFNGGLGYNFNTQPKNIKPFSKVKFLKKAKYLRLIKDLNFYTLPKQFSFRTDLNRSYLETKMRNTSNVDIDLPEMYSKLFTMSRIYNMKYDLSRSVKLNFSARSHSIVDEPYGRIDTKQKRDSLFSNIFSLGRPTEYHHNFDIRYNLPISKIPILSWINTSVNYDAGYDWRSSSLAAEDFGNTIQNNNSTRVNTQFNLTSLYNKVPFLKKMLSTNNSQDRSRINSRSQNITNQKETNQKSSVILKSIVKSVFSLKNISFSYTETNGTLLPGFLPQADFFGLNNPLSSSAPTLGFVLGSQNDIRIPAANNNWITSNPDLNNLYTNTFSNNLNIRATVEPISRFKIMLTASRRYTINENEYFRNSPSAIAGSPIFEHVSNSRTGNFNISFLPIKTAFVKDRIDNSSSLFDNFINYRYDIAQRLADGTAFNNNTNSYPDGYGPNSQDVMIPAFLAAYSGVNPNKQFLNKFPSIPMPNWNINFNGFTKVPWIKRSFKNVTMSHSYRSSYSVGSFISNLLFEDQLYDSNNNFISEFQIDQINITEQFAPFFKLDLTMKNSMTTRFEYKQDRTISLSLSNSQITEVKGYEYVFGFGYRVQGVQLMFDGGSGQKQVSSDLDLRADISIRNNKTIIRRIEEESNQPTSGQSLITLKFSADYVVNNRVNLKLFYDQVVTDYVVSSSFPTSNTNVGVSLRFTLM
ncbi:MAG: cell surface protein SprA [Flavobacteriales bacterium TMED191]|nr:MAG: cell surface protein SprA [Flavobacteriales bacterium TMED191]